jgi:lysozyme family protein
VEWIVDRWEGGTPTNDPADRGGVTRWGITLPTLQRIKPEATAGDVWALTRDEAVVIYLDLFVRRPGFHQIADWRLRLVVIDSGIHSGTARATRWLQAAVGAVQDGIGGPETYGRTARLDPGMARDRVFAARLRHVGRLIESDRRQARFAAGWMDRIATVLEAA